MIFFPIFISLVFYLENSTASYSIAAFVLLLSLRFLSAKDKLPSSIFCFSFASWRCDLWQSERQSKKKNDLLFFAQRIDKNSFFIGFFFSFYCCEGARCRSHQKNKTWSTWYSNEIENEKNRKNMLHFWVPTINVRKKTSSEKEICFVSESRQKNGLSHGIVAFLLSTMSSSWILFA